MDSQQAGNYNCQNVSESAYGAGDYGACTNVAQTNDTIHTNTQPAAPNTGSFMGFVTSGSTSILLPLVTMIIIVLAATIAVARKKHTNQAK